MRFLSISEVGEKQKAYDLIPSESRPPQKVQPSCTDSFEPPHLPARTRDFRQFLSEPKQRESRHFQVFQRQTFALYCQER